MAREEDGPILEAGDVFPAIEFESINGNSVVLPDDFAGKWTVLLFYRGHW